MWKYQIWIRNLDPQIRTGFLANKYSNRTTIVIDRVIMTDVHQFLVYMVCQKESEKKLFYSHVDDLYLSPLRFNPHNRTNTLKVQKTIFHKICPLPIGKRKKNFDKKVSISYFSVNTNIYISVQSVPQCFFLLKGVFMIK